MHLLPRLATVLALGCVTLGCADSQLAPARGTVQRDGTPLMSGRVVFRPLNDGRTAIGTVEADGTFVMKVSDRQKGAQVGENHVLVIEARASQDDAPSNFRAPIDGRVMVEPKQDNEFLINISEKAGWCRIEE